MTQKRPNAALVIFQRKALWYELAVIAIIGAVSIGATFPLLLHLTDRIPGWPGDNLYFFWELGWFKRALLDLHISPFVSPELYYPVGLELARDEITLSNTLLGLPLTAALGPTISYNLLVLISFLLSGYAVYRFIFEGTGNRAAALVGGIMFAIAPYRMAHLIGHLNLLATQWLVLSLLFLERMFRSRRATDGAIAGIFFGLNALAAWYYFFIGLFAVTIFVAVRSWDWRVSWRNRRLWYGIALFAVFAAIFIIPTAVPYLALRQSGDLQRAFLDFDSWSANLTDLVQPNPLNPIWGDAIRQLFPIQWHAWVERTLTTGWVALALAIIGVWRYRRNRTVQSILVIAIASFVIALGPTLHWDGQRVEFLIPRSFVATADQLGITAAFGNWFSPTLAESIRAGRGFVPLPAMLMYALVPFASSMRVVLRFGLVTILGVTVLAGYGASALLDFAGEAKLKQTILTMAICVVAMFDVWSIYPTEVVSSTAIQPRAVDEWLASQPTQSLIVEFPLIQNVNPTEMIYQTFNKQRTVFGGLAPSFKLPVLSERADRLKSFPSQDALSALKDWKTRYVLVTPSLFVNSTDWVTFQKDMAILPGVRFVSRIGDVDVYEIE